MLNQKNYKVEEKYVIIRVRYSAELRASSGILLPGMGRALRFWKTGQELRLATYESKMACSSHHKMLPQNSWLES